MILTKIYCPDYIIAVKDKINTYKLTLNYGKEVPGFTGVGRHGSEFVFFTEISIFIFFDMILNKINCPDVIIAVKHKMNRDKLV